MITGLPDSSVETAFATSAGCRIGLVRVHANHAPSAERARPPTVSNVTFVELETTFSSETMLARVSIAASPGCSTRARPAAFEAAPRAPPLVEGAGAPVGGSASAAGSEASASATVSGLSTSFFFARPRELRRGCLGFEGDASGEEGFEGTRRISLGMGQGLGFTGEGEGPPSGSVGPFDFRMARPMGDG